MLAFIIVLTDKDEFLHEWGGKNDEFFHSGEANFDQFSISG